VSGADPLGLSRTAAQHPVQQGRGPAALAAVGRAAGPHHQLRGQLGVVGHIVAHEHVVHGLIPAAVREPVHGEVTLQATQVIAHRLGKGRRLDASAAGGAREHHLGALGLGGAPTAAAHRGAALKRADLDRDRSSIGRWRSRRRGGRYVRGGGCRGFLGR